MTSQTVTLMSIAATFGMTNQQITSLAAMHDIVAPLNEPLSTGTEETLRDVLTLDTLFKFYNPATSETYMGTLTDLVPQVSGTWGTYWASHPATEKNLRHNPQGFLARIAGIPCARDTLSVI